MPGGASKWWLDKSLRALASDIAGRGGRLVLRRARRRDVLDEVMEETGAEMVVWNRRYDAAGRAVDAGSRRACARAASPPTAIMGRS